MSSCSPQSVRRGGCGATTPAPRRGVISPILLVFIMLLARDRRVLGEFTADRITTTLGWGTVLAMAGAAVALLATLGG